MRFGRSPRAKNGVSVCVPGAALKGRRFWIFSEQISRYAFDFESAFFSYCSPMAWIDLFFNYFVEIRCLRLFFPCRMYVWLFGRVHVCGTPRGYGVLVARTVTR